MEFQFDTCFDLRSVRTRFSSFLLPLLLVFQGCGYTLKQSTTPLLESNKIKTIYLEPIQNDTFKAGIEVVVFDTLQRQILRSGILKITRYRSDADAVLLTTVESAKYEQSFTTPSDNLQPKSLGSRDRDVATVYNASLACRFQLKKGLGVVWSQVFSRAKNFAASTQLGTLGTTSALINESEFDRALSDLSSQVLSDAMDDLLAAF